MRIVYIYATLSSIFIGGRENAKGINAVDFNDSNIRYSRGVQFFC